MDNKLSSFESALTDICVGWIGFELGWQDYIKSNSKVLLEILIDKKLCV